MRSQEILKKILIITAISAVVIYSFFKLYSLYSGPSIEIDSPQNGEKVDKVFTVTGRIQRADKIYLFDREIWTDQDGYFKESVVSSDKYTPINISASNRWGKTNSISLMVENKEEAAQ
ncbi:MAG: hypothetical protein QG614_44 [Patescibacteria group bacterium]|nr:hypothetical protein [Patescibacteria group bacterium]